MNILAWLRTVTFTDVLALIGCATGCTSLYKTWRSGPRLKVSVNPNMKVTPPLPSLDEKRFLMVSVRNTGNAKTAIQAMGICYFASSWKHIVVRVPWLSKFRMVKPDSSGIATNWKGFFALPAVLDGGEQWKGMLPWNDLFVEAQTKGVLYVQLEHSMSNRAIFSRVRF